jgi:hypothetical protein
MASPVRTGQPPPATPPLTAFINKDIFSERSPETHRIELHRYDPKHSQLLFIHPDFFDSWYLCFGTAYVGCIIQSVGFLHHVSVPTKLVQQFWPCQITSPLVRSPPLSGWVAVSLLVLDFSHNGMLCSFFLCLALNGIATTHTTPTRSPGLLHVHLLAHLPIRPPAHPFAHLSVFPSAHPPIRSLALPPAHLLAHPHTPIHLPGHMQAHMPRCMPRAHA